MNTAQTAVNRVNARPSQHCKQTPETADHSAINAGNLPSKRKLLT